MEAYCVKCRKKVEIKNPKAVTLKNGKPATKGECPKCGTGVFRIGSGSAKPAAKSAAKPAAKPGVKK
jgi:hypothetical protein